MSDVTFRDSGGKASDKVKMSDEGIKASAYLDKDISASQLAEKSIRVKASSLDGRSDDASNITSSEEDSDENTPDTSNHPRSHGRVIRPSKAVVHRRGNNAPSKNDLRTEPAELEIHPESDGVPILRPPSAGDRKYAAVSWQRNQKVTDADEAGSESPFNASEPGEIRVKAADQNVEIKPGRRDGPSSKEEVLAGREGAEASDVVRNDAESAADIVHSQNRHSRQRVIRKRDLVYFAADRFEQENPNDLSAQQTAQITRGAVQAAAAAENTARAAVWSWKKAAQAVRGVRSFAQLARSKGLLAAVITTTKSAISFVATTVSGALLPAIAAVAGFLLLFLVIVLLIFAASDMSFGVTDALDTDTLDALYSYVTLKDAELTAQLNREASRTGYDEVRINFNGSPIAEDTSFEIKTNVNQLLVFLQAANSDGTHTVADLKGQIDTIYSALYSISTDEITETVTETTTAHAGDSLGTVVTSAYCPCSICCGKWAGGPTASGRYPQAQHTLAVDAYHPIVPLGTQIIMNGILYTAEDTGNLNAHGVNFDVFFDSHQEALAWGHKSFEAFIAGDEGTEVQVTVTKTIHVLNVNVSSTSLYSWINDNADDETQEYVELINAFGAYAGYAELDNPFGRHWTVQDRYGSYANGTSISTRNYITVLTAPGQEITCPVTGTASWSGTTVSLTSAHTGSVLTMQGVTALASGSVTTGSLLGRAADSEVTITYQRNGSYVNPVFYLANEPASGGEGIVEMALSQVGQVGGQPYWSWYGFGSRVSWCACFVSWCADQCDLISTGLIPKYSACSEGAAWFQRHGQWAGRGYTPSPGDIIFFINSGDTVSHHTGIVVSSDGSTVQTVEGNSSDSVRIRVYSINSTYILGYGLPAYSS